jgi:hypothetical protein
MYDGRMDRLTRRDALGRAGVGILAGCGRRDEGLGAALMQLPEQSPGTLEFSESVVAGGPSDFMVVRHLRLKGPNRLIGRKMGEIARTRHRCLLERRDPALVRARWRLVKMIYPAMYERAAGVADTYGLQIDKTDFDCLSLAYNVEVSAGCSTVYYPKSRTASGHAVLSRNFDFTTASFAEIMGTGRPPGARAMTADPYVIEMYPEKGYPSLYLCAYDLLGACIDGVNSEGLSVALLADDFMEGAEPTRGPQAGFNEIEISRFLLDQCANVEEAREALFQAKQYYSFLPCHYIVGDRHGASFVWEYSESHNKEFVTPGRGRPQIVTNHGLHDPREAGQANGSPSSSMGRFKRLQEEIGRAGPRPTMDQVKHINACVRAAPEQGAEGVPRTKNPTRTLWHSLYDLEERGLEVDFYLGEELVSGRLVPRRSGYRTFKLSLRG